MLTCPAPVLIAHHQPLRNYERIVIATDLSETGTQAIRHGLIFAAINGSQTEIVHAVENWFEGRWYRAGLARDAIEREHEEDKQAAETRLREQVATTREQVAATRVGGPQIKEPIIRVATGQPEEVIWRAVTGERTDLVVMGLVGRSGFQRLWIGNTAERLLPEIPCSLLAVKPEGYEG
jgi:universal stress protein E